MHRTIVNCAVFLDALFLCRIHCLFLAHKIMCYAVLVNAICQKSKFCVEEKKRRKNGRKIDKQSTKSIRITKKTIGLHRNVPWVSTNIGKIYHRC